MKIVNQYKCDVCGTIYTDKRKPEEFMTLTDDVKCSSVYMDDSAIYAIRYRR